MEKFNFFAGATIGAWLLVVLVILAELVGPFKDALKAIFWHHWIGKGILVLLAFLIAGFWFKNKERLLGKPVEKLAWQSCLASLAIILLFYVIEFVL